VGGAGTRSVISGHSGLVSTPLFTPLPRLSLGDTFSVDILSQTFSYQIVTIETVSPDDTEALKPQDGRDLITLLTCTPIGINSQRLLVTGERVTDAAPAGTPAPTLPQAGFPWWAAGDLAGLTVSAAYVVATLRTTRQKSMTSEA